MSNSSKNQNCNIACWVAGIVIGLLLFFMMRPGMGFLLALVLAVIIGGLIIWGLKTFFCKADEAAGASAAPAPASAAPAPASATAPSEAKAEAPAVKAAPEPVEEPAAPAAEPAAATETSGPEVLSAARDGNADDLKKIKGVGPGLEKTLNELGFYHFDQIAAWTEADIEWVDERLKFKGRITRDDWIAQAKEFSGK